MGRVGERDGVRDGGARCGRCVGYGVWGLGVGGARSCRRRGAEISFVRWWVGPLGCGWPTFGAGMSVCPGSVGSGT